VLTYFEKSAEFFRIPYASVALIAIPFTCVSDNNPSDFLAIPHEAGHYVYRRLQSDDKNRLRQQIAKVVMPDDYRGWVNAILQEMCADIYGCLIGGPVMALDFQSLSQENSEADFLTSDGEHPNAAIRPFIYCQVLGSESTRPLIQGDWHSLAADLSQHWSQVLLQRHATDYVIKTSQTDGQKQIIDAKAYNLAATYYANKSNTDVPNYGTLGNVIHAVVEAVIKLLVEYATANSLVKLPGWALPLAPDTTADDLFAIYDSHFEAFVKDLKDNHPVPKDPKDLSATATKAWKAADHSAPTWRAWVKLSNTQASDDHVSKFVRGWLTPADVAAPAGAWAEGEQIPSGEVKDPSNMTPGTWGYILYAGGWAKGGPWPNEYGQPEK
jgi:hypothetical protein